MTATFRHFDPGSPADGAPWYSSPINGEAWPEPKPLPSGLLPVASFDPDYIPASLGSWVADIAERMQAPPDFVAIPAVVALASTLGRKVAVRPQAKTDWMEVPNLWGCIVGRPGALKSPAMAEALKPLNRLEAETRKDNEEELKSYNVEVAAHKLRQEEGQKAARAAIKSGSRDVADLIDLDEPEKPAARRYIVGDTTYEKLGEILVDNPNGILAFRDELVSLLKTLDREEHINARGFFLTGWNGTSGYPFDRIGRGSSYIDAVCISLLGSTQPGRISEYLSRVTKDSAGNDGLIQRFALLVWPDDTGTWREVDRYPDTAARTTAWDTFTRMNLLLPEQVGATKGEYDAIPSLGLDEAARGLFREWRGDLETRLRSGGMHSALESHLAKYRKLVPTLALLNHLADGGNGPVGHKAVLRAVAFSEYLETHARRAYGSVTVVEAATARSIMARIGKGDLKDGFTARDIQRHDWSNLSDKEQIGAGLDLLDDLGWIKSSKSNTGGRPKTTYTINPRGRR